jgi:hypothetical protein
MRPLFLLLAGLILSACATRPTPLPTEHAWALPWGAVDPETGRTVGIDAALGNAGRDVLPPDEDGNGRPDYALLVVSGGGAKGAFGAGVLSGWTDAGNRPEFRVVTGVSTGALMATWAFLGNRYDGALEWFYTQTEDDEVFRKRNPLLAPFGDSLLDTGPLQETIAEAVDDALLAEVAAEYHKGRRLYVASTDLDQGRLVVWDLGGIAASDHPRKLQRYRAALLASASIPVGFPPVYFPVEVDGQTYSQMHVDGGAIANLFLTDFMLERQRLLAPAGIERADIDVDLYLLLNSQLLPQPDGEPVKPRLVSIATATGWATSWAAQTDRLARAYLGARDRAIGFHIIGIPDDYPDELPLTSFDPATMGPLFRFGANLARTGDFWLDAPPGVSEIEKEAGPLAGPLNRGNDAQ